MGWKKYWKVVNSNGNFSPISGRSSTLSGENATGVNTYPNILPSVYTGHQNRLERYNAYEAMDLDSEVNAALDILSEFSTQDNEETQICFELTFKEKPTETESKIIKQQLAAWYHLNEFQKRAFRMFRNVLKYGDQIFIRDPETFKLFYVEISNLVKVIVNESKGKKPEQYVVKNLNVNLENLTVTQVTADNLFYTSPNTTGGGGGGYAGGTMNMPNTPFGNNNRFVHGMNEHAIAAENVLHLSLTEGLDPYWPFGVSILELIYKVYKQKELLEDAIIIYRVQRAPERRVFKIDVGDMPSHLAMAFIDKVKNEIHQRRIPSGGSQSGGNWQDSVYSGNMAPNSDFFFPQTSSGRGSSVEQLPGGCLKMSTRVPLLDGRTLTLNELTQEFNDGKENWVYSCNPETGEVVPGIITWSGVTQKSAKVLKITLDNGKTITATPDHKFPIIGRGKIAAKDIIPGIDSLISFESRLKSIVSENNSKSNKLLYHQVYNHGIKKWEFTHRIVARYFKNINTHNVKIFDDKYINSPKTIIHHNDYNKYNNSPTNLFYMNYKDHLALHQKINSDNYALLSDEEKERRIRLRVAGLNEYWKNITPEELEKKAVTYRQNALLGSKALQELLLDEEYNKNFGVKIHNGWEKFKKKKKKFKSRGKKISAANKQRHETEGYSENIAKKQRIKVDDLFFGIIQNIVISTEKCRINDVLNKVNENQALLDYFLEINKETKCNRLWTRDKFNQTHLLSAIKNRNYTGWVHFKNECSLYNHKVVNIEYLETPIEVGTLTIDGGEKYHNFHNFALEVGVFTQNSNLSEIDDLRFFTNKMMRGLRIPSSYLPTGPDDSPATINDGRVGTALIQEFRFNQYCQRLQRLICGPLDTEFKAYLKWCGITIDSSIFELSFNPPQNFAHYRQAELDGQKIGTYTQLEAYPYFSKRWLLERFLGLSQDEINENNRLWREENTEPGQFTGEPNDLRQLGITPGGIDTDMQNFPTGEEGGEGETGGEEGGAGNEAGPAGGNAPIGGAGPVPGAGAGSIPNL